MIVDSSLLIVGSYKRFRTENEDNDMKLFSVWQTFWLISFKSLFADNHQMTILNEQLIVIQAYITLS